MPDRSAEKALSVVSVMAARMDFIVGLFWI